MKTEPSAVDVAIVGGGPVGVVAAQFCGLHGLSAAVFEREADVYDLPRAVGLHDDVQRILHNAGLLQGILPWTTEMIGAEFVDAGGKRIIGIEGPPGTCTANGFAMVRTFSQPDAERSFRRELERHADVALRSRHEVESFAENDEAVELVVRDLDRGETRRVEARWLIGCDGARSFVRRSCDISWNSLGYDCDWLVVDLELTGPVELSPYCQQICDPERPVTFVPLPGDMRRWEFQLKPGETREEMEDPHRVWELLSRWVKPRQGRIVRAAVYRFHATIADTFRKGRVFLAGDAAHQTPPFMGQGLCTGVRDVENLTWKLAAVRRGLAGDALLDTYTAERHPFAVAMVEHSTNTGKLIDAYAAMARGGPEPAPELQAYAYGGGRTLPDLSAGFLALDGGEWVGQLLPWATVSTSDREGPFDDLVGRRWAVVATADPTVHLRGDATAFLEELDAEIVTVPQPSGAILGLLLAHEVAVVRPDRVIYGVASAGDLGKMLARLRTEMAAAGGRR